MKIDFSQVIRKPDGEPAQDEKGDVVTLRAVCVAALLRDDDIQPEEKLRRYNLTNRIVCDSSTELDVKEVALIETLVGTHQSTWVYGVVHDIFNSPPSEAAKEPEESKGVPCNGCGAPCPDLEAGEFICTACALNEDRKFRKGLAGITG